MEEAERKESEESVKLNHIRYAASSSTAEAFLTTQTRQAEHSPQGQTNYDSSSRRVIFQESIRTVAAGTSQPHWQQKCSASIWVCVYP